MGLSFLFKKSNRHLKRLKKAQKEKPAKPLPANSVAFFKSG